MTRTSSTVRAVGKASPYGPPEVWIPEECELEAARFVEENYPQGFIFKHTTLISPRGTVAGKHKWGNADAWIKRELPALPIFDSGAHIFDSVHHENRPNINILFAIAKKAQHRVLMSSFMVHACDAMGATMDAVNYVVETSKHWPEDPNMIKVIRRKEAGGVPKYSFDGGRTWECREE